MYVLDATEQVTIGECKNCRIVVGPTSGSVFVLDCTDCVLSIAAKQIRLRDCVRCELRVFVPNKEALIIEVSTELQVGPWDITYPELPAQMALAKLDGKPNHWCVGEGSSCGGGTGRRTRCAPRTRLSHAAPTTTTTTTLARALFRVCVFVSHLDTTTAPVCHRAPL